MKKQRKTVVKGMEKKTKPISNPIYKNIRERFGKSAFQFLF